MASPVRLLGLFGRCCSRLERLGLERVARWDLRSRTWSGLLAGALVVVAGVGGDGVRLLPAEGLLRGAAGVGGVGQALGYLPEPEVRRSKNGVLDTTLRVGKTPTLIGGRLVEVWTYEGTTPGPTLRVRPGDLLRLRLVNDLGNPSEHREVACGRREPPKAEGPEQELTTNIHTHGLQTSPEANGDNPFIVLKPGEVCEYEIAIPPDHPAGLYFYHPHGHPSSLKQMWGGLGGAIIVEGGIDEIPEVKAAKERLLFLQELFLDQHHRVPQGEAFPIGGDTPFTTIPAVESEIINPINGVFRPTITIRPGETQRWRIVNGGVHRFYQLALERHIFHQIGRDGLSLAVTTPAEQILVTPGNRFEVMVKGGPPGIYRLKALAYDQGHPGGALPELHLATIVSAGTPAEGDLPGRLIAQPDLRTQPVVRRRTVDWDGNIFQAPVQFFLNHLQFDPSRIDEFIPVGGAEEWTLRNNDVFQHNFHIHVNPFQVVEVNGKPFSDAGGWPSWWDTFPLPPRRTENGREVPGEVKIRIRPRSDITGKTVIHCHILPHQDNGMMSAIAFVPPGTPAKTTSPLADLPVSNPGTPAPPATVAPPDFTDDGPEAPLVPLVPPELPPKFVLTQSICLPRLPRSAEQPHPQGAPTPQIHQLPRCDPQTVPLGARVQIQLPGTPSRWRVERHSPSLLSLGERRLPSPGRIRGTSELWVFDFLTLAPGQLSITFHESPAWVASSGAFEFPLNVVELPVRRIPSPIEKGLVEPPLISSPHPGLLVRRRVPDRSDRASTTE